MAEQEQAPKRVGTFESLVQAVRSWRTLSVVLLSFSSGMPLGLVWIAIPDWMRDSGVDIRIVGLFTLAQVPWTFNVVWAPLMDRFPPPFLGRRRGWAAIAQVGLLVGTLGLAGVGGHPDAPFVVLALTFAVALAAASQDIAVDAYAVDVLKKEEQGAAVGARIALYRVGMFAAGAAAISLAGRSSWALVCAGLAALYLPMLLVTFFAPEPRNLPPEPKTVREAVWLPFLGFLSRHRAVEILAFVILFKLADNMASALLRPFLVDMGYSSDDRGFALGTIGLIATIGGAIIGGLGTNVLGLGRALWIFGSLQIFSNLGYVVLANVPRNSFLLYGAMGFETLCQGLGTGAFSVLLLRMTQKRFSATQYALFSTSLRLRAHLLRAGCRGHGRCHRLVATSSSPPCRSAFPGSTCCRASSSPTNANPPSRSAAGNPCRPEITRHSWPPDGVAFGILSAIGAALLLNGLAALKALRADGPFVFAEELLALAMPASAEGWIGLVGVVTFVAEMGLFAIAVQAARHGAGAEFGVRGDRRTLRDAGRPLWEEPQQHADAAQHQGGATEHNPRAPQDQSCLQRLQLGPKTVLRYRQPSTSGYRAT